MIKDEFPPEGSRYEGGISDGWQYQVRFRGANLQASLDMIKIFLQEEGFGDVPLPENADILLYFKLPSKKEQIILFKENGYAHNPIKILFDARDAKALILCIFNINVNNHLLRFHGKID
jgi:hypothetical protein